MEKDYKSRTGAKLEKQPNGTYLDSHENVYYIVVDEKPIPLISPETGGPLEIKPDGKLYSPYEKEYYKFDKNYKIISAEYKSSRTGAKLEKQPNGTYLDSYENVYYIVVDEKPIPLISPETGGPLEIKPDGKLYSPYEKGYFQFDVNKKAFIPLFIPDITDEPAHLEGNYLVGNETGRKFYIDEKGNVNVPCDILEGNQSYDELYEIVKNRTQIDIDIKLASEAILPDKFIRVMIEHNEKIIDVIKEIRKIVPNFNPKDNHLFDLGGMNFEQIKFNNNNFIKYLNKYKELYMKHAQGILNEEETIMLLSMQSFMDKHDYSISSIKTELFKYEISKLENFKVEETGISFK